MDLEDLFKQICLQEANNLNDFWNNCNSRIAELETEYEYEKLQEKTRELQYINLCKDIDDILVYDGYIGNYADVIDYFSRTHLNYTVKNSYFDIHPKLRDVYNLLPSFSDKLSLLQKEYNKLKIKMSNFKHINEEILINSILQAFQEIISDIDYDLDWIIGELYFPQPIEKFPHTIKVQEQFIDWDLVSWYKDNIDNYLCASIQELSTYERPKIFI